MRKFIELWLLGQLLLCGVIYGHNSWYIDRKQRPTWCEEPYSVQFAIGWGAFLPLMAFLPPSNDACKVLP